jgi:hypothetical protein
MGSRTTAGRRRTAPLTGAAGRLAPGLRNPCAVGNRDSDATRHRLPSRSRNPRRGVVSILPRCLTTAACVWCRPAPGSAMRTIKRDRASRALEHRCLAGTQQAPFASSARAFSLLARHNLCGRGERAAARSSSPRLCRARCQPRSAPPCRATILGRARPSETGRNSWEFWHVDLEGDVEFGVV